MSRILKIGRTRNVAGRSWDLRGLGGGMEPRFVVQFLVDEINDAKGLERHVLRHCQERFHQIVENGLRWPTRAPSKPLPFLTKLAMRS